MGENVGKVDEILQELEAPKATLLLSNIQKSVIIILAQIRTKPVKPEAKDKKAKTLKSELQLIRKLGVKEDDVLPKAIHEAAIKVIATGGGQ